MSQPTVIRGWRLHHHEQLFVRSTIGAHTIRFKFFQYPSYRQVVHIDQPPAHCKLKTKGNNTFYLCQEQVHAKAVISLERRVRVYPQPTIVSLSESWGRISGNPESLRTKYAQSFTYWPVDSPKVRAVSDEHWFSTDDLSAWVREAYRYITTTIKYPEKQEKRLGADQALLSGIGDCDEFTDLFITLARIRGIPCRRLTGYFIPNDYTNLEPHAWAEVLSPAIGWIPVDIAMHTVGQHTIHYVIQKLEEFNPSLPDYQIQDQQSAMHSHWERPPPEITPLY